MKRSFFAVFLFLILLMALPALADNWVCPQCGRVNDSNFCPEDGTARPTQRSASGQDGFSQYFSYAEISGTLSMKLATRTGPGTGYDEPGTFLKAGDRVTVLSKAYDASNEIWWVQVEFSEGGQKYRAYTGIKRFSDVSLASLPEERELGSCIVSYSQTGYYGPSSDYKAIKRAIPAGVSCSIYGYVRGTDSDYIQIEFYDSGLQQSRRAWVPDWAVDEYVMYGNSGFTGF